MNPFLEWLTRLFGSWKFWIVIAPWDVGVRVRLGKNAVRLEPGPHWRIPFIDEVWLVNTRLRACSTAQVSVQSGPLLVSVRTAVAGFRIVDPLRAITAYSHPESMCAALLTSEITHGKTEAEALVALRESMGPCGIEIDFVRLIEDCKVKTYRLMNGGSGLYVGAMPQAQQTSPVRDF